mmetsp:Transcript_5444/g.10611  ORF Transcript_5444/g.10611 Transcript_5444/m.10611 type:complete len:1084 (+) Transcript_5444:1-3252(+)
MGTGERALSGSNATHHHYHYQGGMTASNGGFGAASIVPANSNYLSKMGHDGVNGSGNGRAARNTASTSFAAGAAAATALYSPQLVLQHPSSRQLGHGQPFQQHQQLTNQFMQNPQAQGQQAYRGFPLHQPQAQNQGPGHAQMQGNMAAPFSLGNGDNQFVSGQIPENYVLSSNNLKNASYMNSKFYGSKAVPSTIAVPQSNPSSNNGHAMISATAVAPSASRSTSILAAASTAAAELPTCVHCSYPGADVKIAGCAGNCAFHARCINLVELCQQSNSQASKKGSGFCIHSCPHCKGPAQGLEIIPLQFNEMDRAHGQTMLQRSMLVAGLTPSNSGDGQPNASASAYHANLSALQLTFYDPTTPRTGRWTPDEISFRDSLISHFLYGSLPLVKGLKLNDFLPNMLKSKQSRLAKKMKHAKLSTKYFHPKLGCIENKNDARDLSRLEANFVNGIADPVERSEIRFHMQREWRDHFAERCALLGISFEATAWIQSVDTIERRLGMEKNRNRMAKRRYLMGKAMEHDAGGGIMPGVFVEEQKDDVDLDVALESATMASGGNHVTEVSGNGGNIVTVANYGRVQGTGKNDLANGGLASSESNFRHAAPFLSCVTSYLEKNAIPFEHVDLWIPSFSPPSEDSNSASGDNLQQNLRLCFGGSATVGSQLIHEAEGALGNQDPNPGFANNCNGQFNKRVALTPEEALNFSLFGEYSQKFSFSSGCGLPGRVFKSGNPSWEQSLANSSPGHFERSGGAMQFGINTALALPIYSRTVGRIVLIMYSKHDRVKDFPLMERVVRDMRVLNPSPKWKLVVEVGPNDGAEGDSRTIENVCGLKRPAESSPTRFQSKKRLSSSNGNSGNHQNHNPSSQDSISSGTSVATDKSKDDHIKDLVLLLGENIPSDPNSPLGRQLNGIMTLRLILLRSQRSSEEQQLVDTILVLFESYVNAGRSRPDIAVMITRDFSFHSVYHQQRAWQQQQQNHHAQGQVQWRPPMMHMSSQQNLHQQQNQQIHNRPVTVMHSNHHASVSPTVSPVGETQQQNNFPHKSNINCEIHRRHSNYVPSPTVQKHFLRANSSTSENHLSPRSTVSR